MDLTFGSSRHSFQMPFANFRSAAAIAAIAAVSSIVAFSPAFGGMAVPSGATLLEGDGIRIAFDSAENGFNCIGIENRVGMYCDSTRFRMPAVIGAVWRDFGGTRRYTVLVNVSGEEQAFPCGEGAERRTVVIPPREVVSTIEAL